MSITGSMHHTRWKCHNGWWSMQSLQIIRLLAVISWMQGRGDCHLLKLEERVFVYYLCPMYIYTSEAAILSSRELPRFWMTMMWFLCLRTRHWSCEIRTPFCYSINEMNCDNHIISLFILLIPWKRWAFSVQHSRGPTDDSQAEAIRLGKALGQFISKLYQSPEASFDRQVCRLDNVVFRDY